MIKHTTTIHEVCRKELGISRDEYALCQYAHYRAADPRQKKAGWCCDKKEDVAEFIGITRAGLYKMLDKVSLLRLVDIDATTGYFRITPRFIDAENQAEKQKKNVNKVYTSKKERVNKVDTDCKQSLHDGVNKVTVNIEGIERVKKEEGESAPAPAIFPEYIEPAVRHNQIPSEVKSDDDLYRQMCAFYKANPNEWTDGVCKVGSKKYTLDDLRLMLKKCCANTFIKGNVHMTFAQHHTRFKMWIIDQPAFAAKEKPQPTNDPSKGLPVYR